MPNDFLRVLRGLAALSTSVTRCLLRCSCDIVMYMHSDIYWAALCFSYLADRAAGRMPQLCEACLPVPVVDTREKSPCNNWRVAYYYYYYVNIKCVSRQRNRVLIILGLPGSRIFILLKQGSNDIKTLRHGQRHWRLNLIHNFKLLYVVL